MENKEKGKENANIYVMRNDKVGESAGKQQQQQ